MALINRISRLIRADVHAVLDTVEEPEVLLKQAIRDMEEELAALERRVKFCAHDRETLVNRIEELENSLVGQEEQLDLCFESGEDDLAKELIRRKLEAQRLLQRLATRRQEMGRGLEQQQGRLGENRATLESLRQKAELFTRTAAPVDGPSGFDEVAWSARQLAVTDGEVEIAFLQEKSRRRPS